MIVMKLNANFQMIAAIHFVALLFLAGNLALHGFAQLPPLAAALPAAAALAGLASRRAWALAAGAFGAGFLCALLAAHDRLGAVLAPELEGATLHIAGRVASIPLERGRYSVLDLDVERVTGAGGARTPRKVRVKLYGGHEQVRAGDRLQMRARLKRPRGYSNPGAFDYGKWLFMRGIGATGYARDWQKTGDGSRWSPLVWRQVLLDKLRAHRAAHLDSVAALSLGFSQSLAPEHSRVLAATGTRHLFAVSGLHIGLVFGMFFLALRALWSRLPAACLRWPPQCAASVAALPFAFGYALLAGFSLPTQRALVMLLCFVFGTLHRRRLTLAQALSASLLAVLLWDPFASLSVSFWMSFTAVAFIVLFVTASVRAPGWRQWVGMQAGLSLAMILPALLFFSRGSVIAPLANLAAVPLVSFLVLPASLLATAFAAFAELPAALLLRGADALFEGFWRAGAWLAAFDGAEWFHRPPAWALLSAAAGVALLALARARLKPLALVFLLPLLNQASPPPAHGDFEAVFLDVGQGLSVFIATRRHTLLYDTGPAWPSFSTGEAVVAPYLKSRGVANLDMLIVSHTDNDHAGGADGVLRHVGARQLLGGEAFDAAGRRFEACRDGRQWVWDGVRFEILHPAAPLRRAGNNASCVLKITAGGRSLLLTADIEKAAERKLLNDGRVASEVMLVPHHGSRTSSAPAFIDKVSPRFAVVTSGYRNSFGFPKEDIIQRYRDRGIRVLNTADTGALTLHFSPSSGLHTTAHRDRTRRYWD